MDSEREKPKATRKGPGRPPTRALEDQSPFERWITASGRTKEEISAEMGWSLRSLYRVLSGTITPSLAHAVQVENFTGGAVLASSFLAQRLVKKAKLIRLIIKARAGGEAE